jgi:hypothetical protein
MRRTSGWTELNIVQHRGHPSYCFTGCCRITRKRLLPRFGEQDALKIKPSEIKGWLESVQDEEDLENSTVDKIRRVMHLIYSMAQANDLIPRTVEANPVKHVHIATTTEYETATE